MRAPPRTRMAVAASVVALVVVVARNPVSELERAAEVDVRARVLLPDGSPGEGLRAALIRETSVGEFVGGFFLASFTIFTACLVDPPPEFCRRGFRRVTTVSPDGEVGFHLSGRDTQTVFGNANRFALSARVPDGPSTTARFRIQTEQLRLPALRLWQTEVRFEGATRLRGERLPSAGHGDGAGYRALFEDTAGTGIWTFSSDGTDLRFDPRVLEDAQGTVAVEGAAQGTVAVEGAAQDGSSPGESRLPWIVTACLALGLVAGAGGAVAFARRR